MGAELNLHKNLLDPEIHDPKDFLASLNNDMDVKSERGVLLWEQRVVLLPALSIVSSMAAPPTEVNGDIYILQATGGNLDVNTIAWQSGNIVRYTFNGTPDLSAYATGDYLKVTTATLLLNNGRFVITTVNDGADWIEVTNTSVSDATMNEASNSPAIGQVTKSNWDGCGQGEWVRYNLVDNKWWFIVPFAGMLCYILDSGTWYTFSGSTLTSAGSQTNITAYATGGQANAYQLTKKKNKCTIVGTTGDSIKAPDAFIDNEFILINAGANPLDLFPKTGQNFWNQGANAAFALSDGQMVKWYCFTAGEWEQI